MTSEARKDCRERIPRDIAPRLVAPEPIDQSHLPYLDTIERAHARTQRRDA